MQRDPQVHIYFAWWLKPYFWCLAWVSVFTGREVDEERATYWIDRAIRVKVIP